MSGESWEVKFRRFGEKYPRLVGVATLLVGGAACYWSIGLPLQRAAAHAREVNYQGKIVLCAVMITVFGLGLTLFGSSVKQYLQANPTKSKVLGIAIVSVAALAGFVVAIGTRQYLQSRGYTFR